MAREPRDGKRGTLQIVFGLLCTREGCPVAVEVYEGNTADPRTLKDQIDKLRRRFGPARVVFVADGGLLTSARPLGACHAQGRNTANRQQLAGPRLLGLARSTGVADQEHHRTRHRRRYTLRQYPKQNFGLAWNETLLQGAEGGVHQGLKTGAYSSTGVHSVHAVGEADPRVGIGEANGPTGARVAEGARVAPHRHRRR